MSIPVPALIIAAVLLAAAIISWCYSTVLDRIHDSYVPDWIWVTVVIGNGLVIATASIAVLVWNGDWAAVVLFFAANLACGVPVIIWQLRQAERRRKEREEG
jgi:hypothetical protein